MDNKQDNADKLSQARSSVDQEATTNTIVSRFVKSMCSCFMPCLFQTAKINIRENTETPYRETGFDQSDYRDSKKEKSLVTDKSNSAWDLRSHSVLKSVYQHANRLLQDYDQSLDKSTIKKWHSYSIYQYRENQLLPMGTSKSRILCKITCSRVQPSATAKKKTNRSRLYQKPSDRYSCNNVDKYWSRRYLLFEKFDQGISLDQEAWYSVTPEAVAEHIAGKIHCDTVFDGFCGAGGMAIKLANTCSRVICNDICTIKLKLLAKNAKVYCVDNIQILNSDYLTIDGVEPDVVFLAPPFGSEQKLMLNIIQPNQLNPPLSKIFGKAITMSRNIVMLLPPNINVHRLGEIIAQQYIDSGIPSSTCSIKIEKIFFMSQLKYMAVYIGSMIDTEINLNDELNYIYKFLKEGEKKIFKHKKVVRYLREKYGMIRLLNLVFQLDKVQKTGTLIEKFYELIRERNLISEEKLAKLIHEQAEQQEAYKRRKIPLLSEDEIVEEQKYVGDDTDKEATLSFYSETDENKGVRESIKIEDQNEGRKSAISGISSFLEKQELQLEPIPRSNTFNQERDKEERRSLALSRRSEMKIVENILNIENQKTEITEKRDSYRNLD